jgi:hypothetical protein
VDAVVSVVSEVSSETSDCFFIRRENKRGAPGSRRNKVSACQCRSMYLIALPKSEFGSTLFSFIGVSSHWCKSLITGWLCCW